MAGKNERCPVVTTAVVQGLWPLPADFRPRQPAWAKGVILYAAQSSPVGKVFVWNDEKYLYVRHLLDKMAVDEGWNLSETLIFVDTSSDLSGFWRNHKPGQPDQQEAQDRVSEFTEIISLNGWEPGEELSITVNGTMVKEDVDEEPWGDGNCFTLQCVLSAHLTYRLVEASTPTGASSF